MPICVLNKLPLQLAFFVAVVYEELFKVFICLHQNTIYAIQRRSFSLRYRREL